MCATVAYYFCLSVRLRDNLGALLPAAVLLWQPYEFDPVWYIIWTLEKLGLAWDVKLPTERDLSRRRVQPQQQAAISN